MSRITPNQLKILEYLSKRPASYQYAIERDLNFAPGLAVGYLMRMLVRGLIEECDPPDLEEKAARGKKYYRVTEKGRSEAKREKRK